MKPDGTGGSVHCLAVSRITSICSATSWMVHALRFCDERPRHAAGHGYQQLSADRTGFMGEPAHHWRDQLGAHRRVLGCIQTFGQARHGAGDNDVALYPLRGTLDRGDVVESDEAGLRRAVVDHVAVAVDAADR